MLVVEAEFYLRYTFVKLNILLESPLPLHMAEYFSPVITIISLVFF